MIPWALVFAADMAAGEVVKKNLRKNEMVGNCINAVGVGLIRCCFEGTSGVVERVYMLMVMRTSEVSGAVAPTEVDRVG